MVGIPFLAGRTSADPFGGLCSAILADEYGFGFCHRINLRRIPKRKKN
jgi:hypothetical protein